jgi:hypothetical protein
MEEHFERLAADLSELETDCINACLEYIKVQISYNKGFCEIDTHPSVVVFHQGEYKPVQVLAVYQEPHGEVIAKLTSDMYLPVSSFELYAIAEAIKLLKDGRN